VRGDIVAKMLLYHIKMLTKSARLKEFTSEIKKPFYHLILNVFDAYRQRRCRILMHRKQNDLNNCLNSIMFMPQPWVDLVTEPIFPPGINRGSKSFCNTTTIVLNY
jgi:hypothetical protein